MDPRLQVKASLIRYREVEAMDRKNVSHTDLEKLRLGAENSPLGESFLTLQSMSSHRIGVGYRTGNNDSGTYFLELVLILCNDGSKLDLAKIESQIVLLRHLKEKKGCSIKCDDGSIICELIVSEADLWSDFQELYNSINK